MRAFTRLTRRLLGVAGCSLAAAIVSGCASLTPAVTAHDVLLEREQALEAESRGELEIFLAKNGARLDELDLPRPVFQGMIEPERWGEAVIDCVESLDTEVRVSRQEGGFGVNYFGMPDGAYERVRWTIESCMVQYGLPAKPPAPGPVEVAWMHQDAAQRLVPCWRSLGYSTLPPALSAAAVRAEALCPSTAAELQRQLDVVADEQ
ncbi:MAG: hypothetical protein Q7J04_09800 [Microcella sp.]|nr:hypothetical protein [Microcella sp.]